MSAINKQIVITAAVGAFAAIISSIITFIVAQKNMKKEQNECSGLKKWLSENKIYFETVAVLILSFMGLIVTIVSVAISRQQSEISEQQLNLSKIQTDMLIGQCEPYFVYDSVENDDNSTENDDIYIFRNIGAPLKDVHLFIEDRLIVTIFYNYDSYDVDIIIKNNYFNLESQYMADNNILSIQKGYFTPLYLLKSKIEDDLKYSYGILDGKLDVNVSLLQYVDFLYLDYKNEYQLDQYVLIADELVRTNQATFLDNRNNQKLGEKILFDKFDYTEFMFTVLSQIRERFDAVVIVDKNKGSSN